MKKNEIIELLLKVLEAVCEVVGRAMVALVSKFPAVEKYFLSFLLGAQTLVNKLLPESSL